MRAAQILVLAAVALIVTVTSAPAHHSFAAEFDANKPFKMTGKVTKVEWMNPHTFFYIDVKKTTGATERWMIEGGTPNTLLRRGLTRKSLPEGTEILVDGYKAKNGSNRANGRDLTFPDGRRLFMGSSGIGAPLDGKDPGDK